MLYEFTYPDRMCGHLINEIEMRAEISGDIDDWTVDKLEFYALEPGRKSDDRWIEVPREHPRRAEFVRYLTTVEVHGAVTDAYAEHVVSAEGGFIPHMNDEHSLRKCEVV